MTTSKDILDFWFNEINPKQWWVKDDVFDKLIKQRFINIHDKATAGETAIWRETPEGRLAEIIVLDQFSRNIYRNDARAFAQDSLALELAKEAVALGADKNMDTTKKSFLYMPFMHSEDIKDHERAVELFSQPGLEGSLDFELKHKRIIEQFGRYPHRNSILGRESTPKELEFLQQPGSSF